MTDKSGSCRSISAVVSYFKFLSRSQNWSFKPTAADAVQCTASLEPFIGGGQSVYFMLSSLAPCQDRRQKDMRVVTVGGLRSKTRLGRKRQVTVTWRSPRLFTFHWHTLSLTVRQGLLLKMPVNTHSLKLKTRVLITERVESEHGVT